jgi:hypothetical protein
MLALVPGARWQAPTRGAITQARQRLGTEAVKVVFQQVGRPTAAESTPGAWLMRRRVMAIDGFVVDLPDTEANVAEFGLDSAGWYETAFPQARMVDYTVPDRKGEHIRLITSILDPTEATAEDLARGNYSEGGPLSTKESARRVVHLGGDGGLDGSSGS